MVTADVRKRNLVPPEPLLDRYGLVIAQLPSMRVCAGKTPTTVSRGVSHGALAFQHLLRGKEDCRYRADEHIDAMFTGSLQSKSQRGIGPVLYSESESQRVYVTDKPFGPLDRSFVNKLDFALIIKEPFLKRGAVEVPDVNRIERTAAIYSELYQQWKVDPSFPQSEIFARTGRRLLCSRNGENLAYECSDPNRFLQEIVVESGVIIQFLRSRPSLLQSARVNPYLEKFVKSALALAPYIDSPHYGDAVLRDAQRIATVLEENGLVPHIDPTSVNLVVEDGRLRFIDLEKASEYFVHKSHLYAHIWFDPTYDLSFDQRCAGVSVVEGAWYYLLRRAARGMAGRQWAPLEQWVPIIENRFYQNLDNLVKLSGVVPYESAAMLRSIDVDRIKSEFSVIQARTRDAKSSSLLKA